MNKKLQNLTLVLAALPAGLVLWLHGWLGSYTRPLADDFCSLYYSERFDFLRSIWYFRLTWSGRYSAYAADWLEAKVFGAYHMDLTPPLFLAAWLICGVTAAYLLLRSHSAAYRSGPAALAAGILIVFVGMSVAPDVPQAVYWWNGLRTHALPVLALTLYAGFLLAWTRSGADRQAGWVGILASFALAFAGSGFSETYATGQLALLTFMIGLTYLSAPRPRPNSRLKLLLAGLLGSIASLAVLVTAPGNTIRLTEAEVYVPPPGAIEVSVISIQAFVQLLASMLFTPEKLTALLGALLWAGWLGAQHAPELAPRPRRILLYVGVGLLAALACFPPGVYAYQETPPPRTQIIPAFIVAASLLYAVFLAGNRLKHTLAGRLHYGLAAAIVLLGFSAFVQSRTLLGKMDTYAEYARTWDRLDMQILQAKAEGAESVTIPAVQNWAGLNVLNDNPRFWVNDCYTKYYGILVLGPSPD